VCAENGFERRVEIVAAAAAGAPGNATLFVYPMHDAFTSLVPPDAIPAPFLGAPAPITVRVDSLDGWRRQSNAPAIRGVKIDVEKAEMGVLDGMRDMLGDGEPDWIICETDEDGPAYRHLAAAGYRPRLLDLWGPRYGNFLFERRS
jgi:FkbM family methyltransferase